MAILPDLVVARRLILAAAVAFPIIALFALAFTSGTSRPASASFPGHNGKIAFHTFRDSNMEVYAMNADGSGQTNLSTTLADDAAARWSPNGTKIAFQSYRDGNWEVYVMNADGSAPARLTNNWATDGVPTWSPDGTKLAFHSNRTGSWQIYVMNADGSSQTPLTTSGSNGMPSWSPDGTRIAFSSARNGNSFEIYVMNADGSGQTSLGTGAYAEHLDWSPDGSHIAYDKNGDIWLMSADGTGQTRLTDHVADDGGPSWSPDGTRVSFYSFRAGNYDIYSMKPDGSDLTQLTTSPANDVGPDWQAVCDAAGCPTPVPLPSPAPCPKNGCPSPTKPPPPTPTPTLSPEASQPDFSIRIGYSNTAARCDSSGSPTAACELPAGATFALSVHLNALPPGLPPQGYAGFDAKITYTGVTRILLDADPQRWPDCSYDGRYEASGVSAAGCAINPQNQNPSRYTGVMLTFAFACTESGTITLSERDLVSLSIQKFFEAGDESLAVSCLDARPFPGDTDTDHCPDASEGQLDPRKGGQRDFLNPWDFFNPTHDGQNRVDDVLTVVQKFAVDGGSPSYTADVDRTFVGPNKWNLGPPDGTVRVADILAQINQFNTDCP